MYGQTATHLGHWTIRENLVKRGRKDVFGLCMALPRRRLNEHAPCKIDGVGLELQMDTPTHLKGYSHDAALSSSQSTTVKKNDFAAMEYLWVYKQYYANSGLWTIYPDAVAESLRVCGVFLY